MVDMAVVAVVHQQRVATLRRREVTQLQQE
jgi:hypothetical protein